MDFDSFPQLRESDTGWPQLVVPWGTGTEVEIVVAPDTDCGATPVIQITTPKPPADCKGAIVYLNGVEIHAE